MIRQGRGGAHSTAATGAWVLLGVITLPLLWLFRRPLALLVISAAVATALAPLVAALALWLIVLPLAGQIVELIVAAPALAAQAEAWVRPLQLLFNISRQQVAPNLARQASALLLAVPTTVAGVLVDLGLILFMSVYLLIESPRIEKGFLSLFPHDRRDRVREMAQAMGGYLRATAINGAIVAVLTYVGLLLIGVNFPLIFALLSGAMEFVPLIGPTIAAVPVVIVAFLQAPLTGRLALAFMIGVQPTTGGQRDHAEHHAQPNGPFAATGAGCAFRGWRSRWADLRRRVDPAAALRVFRVAGHCACHSPGHRRGVTRLRARQREKG